ncbi:MAG: HPr family phosphocarrier protein [bacterium]
MSEPIRIQKSFVISNRLGLHARPAAMLVEAVSNLHCEVLISKDELTVDAKSLMGVLTLAAEHGSTLDICAQGDDAQRAIDLLGEMISNKFGED